MSYKLDTKYQSQTIFLNSSNALSRNPFLFNFSNTITAPMNMRMLISVEEFIIPNVFNNITNQNNLFEFNTTSGLITISISPGLYNALSFITALNIELSIHNITAVYNMKTFKISFVSTSVISLTNCTCPNILGVSKDNTNNYIYPINSSLPDYTIYMSACVDFSGTSHLFLKCSDLLFQNINSHGVVNSTMCRIPINVPFAYKIFYRPTEVIKFISSKVNINSLSFNIVDSNNNDIDLNNLEFQILLKVDYIYTPQEQGNLLEGSLNYHMNTISVDDYDEELNDENELE
jgi:hypothetical protein